MEKSLLVTQFSLTMIIMSKRYSAAQPKFCNVYEYIKNMQRTANYYYNTTNI